MKPAHILLSVLQFISFQVIAQNEFPDTLKSFDLNYQEYDGSSLEMGNYTRISDPKELGRSNRYLLDSTSISGIEFYSDFIEEDTLSIIGINVLVKESKGWIEFYINFEREASMVNIKPAGSDFPGVFLIEYGGRNSFNRGEEEFIYIEIWDGLIPKCLGQMVLEMSGYGSNLDHETGVTIVQKINYAASVKFEKGILSIMEIKNHESTIEIDSNAVEDIVFSKDGMGRTLQYELKNGLLIRR